MHVVKSLQSENGFNSASDCVTVISALGQKSNHESDTRQSGGKQAGHDLEQTTYEVDKEFDVFSVHHVFCF